MSTKQQHTRERRSFRAEFRDVPGSNGRQKWATAVRYNVVDSYGTLWRPAVFDEALADRLPVIAYGHNWTSIDGVLGAGVDWRQTPADVGPPGVDVLMEFLDDDPIAARAMKLLSKEATSRGPVLRDVSVGFERIDWARRNELTTEELELGAEEAMIRAGMDELSLVIAGAVPGASIRSKRGAVDLDAVVAIAKRKAAGELTEAEAQAALDLLAGDDTQQSDQGAGGEGTGSGEGEGEGVTDAELDATFDAALEAAFGRSR